MTNRLAIIGSGDLGQLIAHHALDSGEFEIAGFFDDTLEAGTVAGPATILGPTSQIEQAYANDLFDQLLVGVGNQHFNFRRSIFQKHHGSIPFATLVHRSTIIDESCRIGEGSIVLAGCVFDRNSQLGENVFLNPACNLAHDSKIGSHSFLALAINVSGVAEVGECCFLGSGTTLIDRIQLCDGTLTAAGAVVTDHTTRPGWYYGIPARLKKTGASERP